MSNTVIPGRRAQPDPFAGRKRAVEPVKVGSPAPVIASVGMTADEIRSRIVALYEQAKPTIITAFYQYSQSAAALSEEYHVARFQEVFPSVPTENLTLVCSLDARETPAKLDSKLAELKNVKITKIVFDRANATYHLFV